ncbi:hypothetical protein Acr_19g0007140 [Actinidia rufa]|uniref:Uncharacterized protein n=1 Tax=Actinidia rufa TaxID=165716 RepID=A0A7J0GAE8_9ERIC|nr:hypothetical protein Acr_19g0007140 [Actinidia rufa]
MKKEHPNATSESKSLDGPPDTRLFPVITASMQDFHVLSPAERVKAKMKLQLSEAAEKDATKGLGSGWERFEFDKDAPLDDEDVEEQDKSNYIRQVPKTHLRSSPFATFYNSSSCSNVTPHQNITVKHKFIVSNLSSHVESQNPPFSPPFFNFCLLAAEDDAALVKHIGQSFRFSAVEARREDQIKAAHDEAMFGAVSIPQSVNTEYEVVQENKKNDSKESVPATSLISDKVISQQGSWRDRARKV